METYAINDVERLTGIKAHTLRIWEKRFTGLIAHRTTTKIRYYDDKQLKKLLNISSLLQNGYKISAIMNLPDNQLQELIVAQFNEPEGNAIYDMYINGLIAAMLTFDERTFDKTLSNIFIRFGVYNAVAKIIYPFMRKTGVLWSIDNAIPAQEHFASCIIRRKLLSAIDGIPYPANSTKKFLLFLPPNELHEIGLLFSDYLIRSAGHETVYLGENVPFSNLYTAIKNCNPDYLLTFNAAWKDLSGYQQEFTKIAQAHPETKIIICANSGDNCYNQANILVFNEPRLLLELL